MTHVIAVSNQKGGVGKTTSAVNISSELAAIGHSVLMVDFDPQGNATSGLGVSANNNTPDLYDLFLGEASLSSIVVETDIERLSVAPSSSDLVGIEVELGKTPGRELILKTQLKLLKATFDYVLVDCPPSLGLLTLNALGAADSVLIPLQAEYYALEGVSSLLRTIEFVRQTFNPGLSLLGVFLTMYDSRTNLSSQVEDEARKFFADTVFETVIPRSVRLSEAPSHGLPISLYAPNSPGSDAYYRLVEELHFRCCGQECTRGVVNR